jgi:hypothetical protein
MSVRANRKRLALALEINRLPHDLRVTLLRATRAGKLDHLLGRVTSPLDERDALLRQLARFTPGTQSDRVDTMLEQFEVYLFAVKLPASARMRQFRSMRFGFPDMCAQLYSLDVAVPHSRSQLHRILARSRSGG